MSPRPTYIDLPNRNFNEETPNTPSPRDLQPASPRDLQPPRSGDVPPPLSPLDAFALQGRMLAQRLEQGAKFDKRITRLPQFYVAKELAKPRPGYSPKETDLNGVQKGKRSSGNRKGKGSSYTLRQDGVTLPAVSQQAVRPQSHYPVLHMDGGEVFDDNASSIYSDRSRYTEDEDDDEEMPDEARLAVAQDYFNSWQKTGNTNLLDRRDSAAVNSPVISELTVALRPNEPTAKVPTNISNHTRSRLSPIKTSSHLPTMYTPPHSPATSLSRMTIRAVSDENSKPIHFLTINDRKTSDSTAHTETRSPMSPLFESPRSPSISSDHSGGASLVPPRQQKINFSRPISNKNSPSPSFSGVSRPTFDTRPSYEKRPSFETRPSFQSSTRTMDANGDQKSIVYSSSPMLKGPQSPLPTTAQHPSTEMDNPEDYTDDEDAFGQYSEQTDVLSPTSPKLLSPSSSRIYARYSLSQGMFVTQRAPEPFDNTEPHAPPLSPTPDTTINRPAVASISHASESPRARFDAMNTLSTLPPPQQHLLSPRPSRPQLRLDTTSPVTPSATTPQKHIPPVPSAHLSPSAHLALGISLHEQGTNLPKSTYHIRLAARAGLPGAMLLYALACRHGWGVKRNEAEAVVWLRKAVEVSGLDLAASSVDIQSPKTSRATIPQGTKAHQTTLALSIYELAMSYRHGWGTDADASQALRLFEMAANLGDVDALVQVAECYRDGVGCKRDLKRAAEALRRAEGLGVVVVGESWRVKGKYCENAVNNAPHEERNREVGDGRGVKRARALFAKGR